MSIPRQQDADSQPFEFGSSVYGGRPTFGLTRRNEGGEPVIRLYELLPDEQAEARKQRLERVGKHLVVSDIDGAFDEPPSDDGHSWDGWKAVKVAQLRGSRLQSVVSVIRDALGSSDIPHKPVTGTGRGEVLVSETTGVELALAFVGVEELKRVDRMRELARGVSRMSTEECYYWYAKCRSPNSPNGVQALRVLLTNHIK
jgi:hypothetical protein